MAKIAGRVCTKCGAVTYCPPAQEKDFHSGWAEVQISHGNFRGQVADICPKCLKPLTDSIGL